MEETIIFLLITILILTSFITAFYIFYRRDKESGLIEKIKRLENQKLQLEQEIQIKIKEIESKKQDLEKLDNQLHPSSELNLKLDFLINNRSHDNTAVLVILIILSTAIIVYCLYEFTYYIQPKNLVDSLRGALNSFR